MMHDLPRFRQLKKDAVASLRQGDRAAARRSLIELADVLQRMAGESSGDARVERLREARELRETARYLDPAAVGSAEIAEGDDGDEKRFRVAERPSVRFDDVAGLEDVKEQFRLKLLYPFLHPEKAARYRLKKGGGILLYGPPGTGKTLLARAVAGEIDATFYTVKPSEIMSKWVGEAEKNIEDLFDEARSEPVSVVFIDEIDALAPRRSESTSPVMARLVPQILAELEGFEGGGDGTLLFLGATNEPWLLDPAILRPGRFDEKIHVGLPDRAALEEMLRLHLDGRPLAPGLDPGRVAARLEGFSGADVRKLCEQAASEAFLDAVRQETDRVILEEDLLRLASGMSPSVTQKMLRRYRDYSAEGEVSLGSSTREAPGATEALRDH